MRTAPARMWVLVQELARAWVPVPVLALVQVLAPMLPQIPPQERGRALQPGPVSVWALAPVQGQVQALA